MSPFSNQIASKLNTKQRCLMACLISIVWIMLFPRSSQFLTYNHQKRVHVLTIIYNRSADKHFAAESFWLVVVRTGEPASKFQAFSALISDNLGSANSAVKSLKAIGGKLRLNHGARQNKICNAGYGHYHSRMFLDCVRSLTEQETLVKIFWYKPFHFISIDVPIFGLRWVREAQTRRTEQALINIRVLVN